MLQTDPISTARVLQSAGRIDEARRLYRRILETDADQLDALIELGTAEIAAGRLADADTLLTRAHAAAPQDSRLIGLHRQLGLALYYGNFWTEAQPWLERAADLAAWDNEIAMARARCRPRDYLDTETYDPLQQRTLKRYSPREAGSYVYTIDIVGTCNLRCPTCPVGNSPAAERPKGFMPVDVFERILGKISRESPVARAGDMAL